MEQSLLCRKELCFECGRMCAHDNFTSIMTRLALVEGQILERLEEAQIVTLHELMETLAGWQQCAIAMAVGSLVRQGMIKSWERGQDVFLQLGKENDCRKRFLVPINF